MRATQPNEGGAHCEACVMLAKSRAYLCPCPPRSGACTGRRGVQPAGSRPPPWLQPAAPQEQAAWLAAH